MATYLRMSPAGLALTKAYEKFSLVRYLDQAKRPTIYWGHLIRIGEVFNNTQVEGDGILVKDMGWAEDCANVWCASKVVLLQNEFDAITDFIFRAGAKAFQGSTLRRLVLAGDKRGAAEQFPHWNKEHDAITGKVIESAGLTKRGNAERALFLGEPWSPP